MGQQTRKTTSGAVAWSVNRVSADRHPSRRLALVRNSFGVMLSHRLGAAFIAVVPLIATLICTGAQATVSPVRVVTPSSERSTVRLDVLLPCDGPGSVRMIVRSDGDKLVAWLRGRHLEPRSPWRWRVTIRSGSAQASGSGVSEANHDGWWRSGQLGYDQHSAVVVRARASTPDQPTCEARTRVPER